MYGLGEGLSTPLSCYLFLTALLGLFVPSELLLRLFSSFDYLFEDSQYYSGFSGHIQNTVFCLNTILGSGNSISYVAAALMLSCQYSLHWDSLVFVPIKFGFFQAAEHCVPAIVHAVCQQSKWPYL